MLRLLRLVVAALVLPAALFSPGSISAQLQPVPPFAARATDTTGTLDPQQLAALQARLAAFEAARGAQIAVLIVPTTRPEVIEQYALRVVEQWKLGRKKVDDGVLLLVAKDDRRLRIEVGYGLEGALGDAVTKRIIAEVISPRFAQGDFAGGVDAGVDAMIRVVAGEPLPAPQARGQDGGDLPGYIPALVVLTVLTSALLSALLGRARASLAVGSVVGAGAWLLAGALSTAVLAAVLAALFTLAGGPALLASGRHHRGGWGGVRGGGGFRGGGGGFGGGGSSGRW